MSKNKRRSDVIETEATARDDAEPTKRKVGRPTKDGLPKAPVEKKPAVVRGRGRPPKKGKAKSLNVGATASGSGPNKE